MSSTSIKRVVFAVFNLIFFILGLAVLGVGIYSRVEDGYFKDIMSMDELLQAPNILIAAGVLVAVIGFLGCVGAWTENAPCLIAYASLVFLIFVLEIAAGIYAYTKKKHVIAEVESGVYRAVMISYGKSDTNNMVVTKAIDWFQKTFKCCGSDYPHDWEQSDWRYSLPKNTTIIVPNSCCVNQTTGCNQGKNATSLGNQIYTQGCIPKGKIVVKEHLKFIGGVAIGIGVVQILGIGFAILLCMEFKDYDVL